MNRFIILLDSGIVEGSSAKYSVDVSHEDDESAGQQQLPASPGDCQNENSDLTEIDDYFS